MYSRILKIIENIFVFLVHYIVPFAVFAISILCYLKIFSPREAQEFFARFGWRVLVFLLCIKPISIIAKRRFQAIYRKLPE